jgi:hypothetical protein
MQLCNLGAFSAQKEYEMRIEFAHYRELSTTGRYVSFAVFDAKPNNNTEAGRTALLAQLSLAAARALNLKIEAAGLVYEEYGQTKSWGHPFVVDYLQKNGLPAPNYYLDM